MTLGTTRANVGRIFDAGPAHSALDQSLPSRLSAPNLHTSTSTSPSTTSGISISIHASPRPALAA